MFRISIIFSLIIIVAVIVVFVYYLLYSRRINAKIAGGEISGRPMVDIPGMIRGAAIVALVLYALIVTIAISRNDKNVIEVSRNDLSVIDLTNYTYMAYNGTLVDTDASYAKAFSKESNEGYKKTVSQEGKFTFTVFTRTGKADSFHPDFFCFVEYTGDANETYAFYETYAFQNMTTGEQHGAVGSGGGGIPESFLVVGNLDLTDSFEIHMSILDEAGENEFRLAEQKAYEEDKGNFPSAEEFAISGGNVVITLK